LNKTEFFIVQISFDILEGKLQIQKELKFKPAIPGQI